MVKSCITFQDSSVDPSSTITTSDDSIHSKIGSEHVYEVTLNPGDILHIPVGWWHEVNCLDLSITISTDVLKARTNTWDEGFWLCEE